MIEQIELKKFYAYEAWHHAVTAYDIFSEYENERRRLELAVYAANKVKDNFDLLPSLVEEHNYNSRQACLAKLMAFGRINAWHSAYIEYLELRDEVNKK